ncbi:hypothetical protein ARHIZOSPH14_19560 [Agromyces rhizosphaerae]|uniref:AAA+ ATPase domain-containing protein n=1 Tax=Agromyces rhizosphaerae TaxID=88374 RepID=A0A9W6CYP5_9MICO|nr:AAA family ATPase [Agromyces rhizosphaerae]GLI27714.1 hypothetical protein ARHIZOSPH14_19560 [Agromyces rhizosphaerae]
MPDLSDAGLVSQGTIPPDEFWSAIDRTAEVAPYPIETPSDIVERIRAAAQDLVVSDATLMQCVAAIIAGNLVLQGPPGTGKTSLASALATAFGAQATVATAREDWTTYDTVGGHELVVDASGAERLVPRHGHFTRAAIDCAGFVARNLDDEQVNPHQARWLILDELNRCEPDRAFGELFTVLGGGGIDNGSMPLRYEPASPLLTVPARFRILATMNSVDKQFVNSLSMGIRRRFTFITLDVPPPLAETETWRHGDSLASREYLAARSLVKPEGEDVAALDDALGKLFGELAKARYANTESKFPYVPVGTAPILEACRLAAIYRSNNPSSSWHASLDWAASVKIAPLFETDFEQPEKLAVFATEVSSAFPLFARELRRVETAGLSYIA